MNDANGSAAACELSSVAWAIWRLTKAIRRQLHGCMWQRWRAPSVQQGLVTAALPSVASWGQPRLWIPSAQACQRFWR